MFRKSNAIIYAAVFLLGLAMIGAAWAYGGSLLPRRPPDGLSTYDAAGFYVDIAIWVVTLISGAMFVISLRSGRRD